MSRLGFEATLKWLREERSAYQTKKFDYAEEANKDVEYWSQQLNTYISRIEVVGIDEPLGVQAALKLAATATALCEHLADKYELPAPGVPSGELG